MQKTRKAGSSAPSNQNTSIGRGAALAKAIEDKAAEEKMSQKDTAMRLGFSDAYYNLLLSGKRWFGSVDRQKLLRISEFLDVPLMAVYMLAEIITPEDFYRTTTVEDQIQSAYKTMATDKRFMTVIPSRKLWDQTPAQVRLFCAVLYQEVSAKDLLEKLQLLRVEDHLA